MNKVLLFCLAMSALASCNNSAGNDNPRKPVKTTPVINYAVKRYLPHDTTSYTEGLLFHNSALFESTGSPPDLLQTRSVAGPVNLTTGKIDTKVEINRSYFGEGIVFLHDKLYQLTYKAKKGFVYDAKNFKLLDSFAVASAEGWGFTTDGTSLIMSDGTSNISYLNPSDGKVAKILRVTELGDPVMQINELEYVNGFLYANVYTTSNIIKIDTQTGEVVGRLDCTSLDREARTRYPGAMEMNGIAWDSTTHTFYVTGKMWPNIYEISFPH